MAEYLASQSIVLHLIGDLDICFEFLLPTLLDICAGASIVKKLMKDENAILTCGGDVLGPSFLSNLTKVGCRRIRCEMRFKRSCCTCCFFTAC